MVNNNSASFLGVVRPVRLAVDNVEAIQYMEKMYCFKIDTYMNNRALVNHNWWLQPACKYAATGSSANSTRSFDCVC